MGAETLMIVGILAALSASAAAGIRLATPLLLIGLLSGDVLWSQVPLVARVPPAVVVGVLVSWSLLEIFVSKDRLGQRFLQILQLLLSPIVGSMAGIAIARVTEVEAWMIPVIGVIGGLLALVLQLFQVGLFFRLRGLPLWGIMMQDLLCIALILFAFDAPRQGGLIAMLLLWLVIRTSKDWQRWYHQGKASDRPKHPRRYRYNPD